jgi:hypothetical protein
MNVPHLLGLGLGGLPSLSDAETRSISAENPTGEKGGGAKAVPQEESAASMLGPGWKVRPCITLEPGAAVTLADVQGPGVIQHIWITVKPEAYRDTVLQRQLLACRGQPFGRFQLLLAHAFPRASAGHR